MLLQRGLAAFGAGLAFLPPFHAHASLLAFASRHNAPRLFWSIEMLKVSSLALIAMRQHDEEEFKTVLIRKQVFRYLNFDT
ncbi:MAG: hypothetical protein ONB46_24215 [candidate division KSB1 bacterium]|nr:hypothetical protein [candidate division KSB1 bacterium]MDZ7368981.1 hypothetical protein [candidate division KSB1 bacterium]MDZ7406981.1 hypothetical protein [candidate division KSB1 bacterium]